MNKKLLCLAMVCVMLFSCGAALAAGSRGTGNMITTTVLGENQTPLGLFGITADPNSADAQKELAKVTAFVGTGKAAIEYFDAAAQQGLASLLPAGFDPKTLKLNEMFGLLVQNYVEGMGDVDVLFDCATPYAAGQTIVAMLGISDGSNVIWTPMAATVENGQVKVHFTEAQIKAIVNGSGMIAVLN